MQQLVNLAGGHDFDSFHEMDKELDILDKGIFVVRWGLLSWPIGCQDACIMLRLLDLSRNQMGALCARVHGEVWVAKNQPLESYITVAKMDGFPLTTFFFILITIHSTRIM